MKVKGTHSRHTFVESVMKVERAFFLAYRFLEPVLKVKGPHLGYRFLALAMKVEMASFGYRFIEYAKEGENPQLGYK